MIRKSIIGIFTLIFALSIKAQEIVVCGRLETPNIQISNNFKEDLFCYFKGNFKMSNSYNDFFYSFQVDSVITGSLPNFDKTPFNIALGLINECTVLDYYKEYTLKIKQIPTTNYYYIDSLNQVFNNEKYLEKLTEYYEDHRRKAEILTTGTFQEKCDSIWYNTSEADYRYISYVLPFITNKDTIITYDYVDWDGYDENGNGIGGTYKYERKTLLSECLYGYLHWLLPFFDLPNNDTDSIGWREWYDSLIQKKCFPTIQYAQSEHKTITGESGIYYFIPDTQNRKIYIRTAEKSFVFNTTTEELLATEHCKQFSDSYGESNSIQNSEIAQFSSFSKKIALFTLTNNTFCQQEKSIPVEYETQNKPATDITAVIHSKNDFFLFWLDNINDRNCLRIGKINRDGKWVVSPKNLYELPYRCPPNLNYGITSFSIVQANKNETVLAFSDEAFGVHNGDCAYGKKNDGVMIYKVNSSLKEKNSSILELEEGLKVRNIYLSKKDNVYLLTVETSWSKHLYYRLLNEDLTPKTDFIKLANNTRDYLIEKPIPTSEGFMITWVDSDLAENILRSVIIDKSGKQSKIINITNQKIDEIYNVELDKNTVDIYLFSQGSLIRKRINKKEYGL